MLERLAAMSKERYVPAYPLATIHAALGDTERAFAELEKAYETRDAWMDYVKIDPRLERLHSDPRFGDVLRRMKLGG